MIRVTRAYEVSDGDDAVTLTAHQAWTVVGTYEAGRTDARTEMRGMDLQWSRNRDLASTLAIITEDACVYVTAETAAELRKRLEEDAQPMRSRASAPITTEERA